MKRQKTWAYWSRRIETEIHNVSIPLLDPVRLKPFPDKDNPLAEDACKKFCDSGIWPIVSPEVALDLEFRLGCALDLSIALNCSQGSRLKIVVRPPDLTVTPEPMVWHFLLIDWWRVNRHSYLKARR